MTPNNPDHSSPLFAIGFGRTETGCIRATNEDAVLLQPRSNVWAIADGMGGYGNGEVASGSVVRELEQADWSGDPSTTIRTALTSANRTIEQKAQALGVRRMGSTVAVVAIRSGLATIGWVGDSRVYLVRQGQLVQLTRDHSWVEEMIDRGEISAKDAGLHPDRNILTRAVGAQSDLDVDLVEIELVPKDRLLLCSDGLHTCISEEDMLPLMVEQTGKTAVDNLTEAALLAGAPDNVSTILIDVTDTKPSR